MIKSLIKGLKRREKMNKLKQWLQGSKRNQIIAGVLVLTFIGAILELSIL
jgi:hypothetical protein